MSTNHFRSRNNNSKINICKTSRIEDNINIKNKILLNLTEYAEEARIIIKNNNTLKQKINSIKKNNLEIKNLINKIITINKDIKNKFKNNNNKNNINKNIYLYKDNLFNIVKEYNNLIKKNNSKYKSEIQKEKEKNENHKNKLISEIENLNLSLEESLNAKFRLENKIIYKDNIILGLVDSYEKIGYILEEVRYRFINEEMSQHDIDKYLSNHLSKFQQKLLSITQNWNKYKNRAIKFQQEIDNLKNILNNPQNIEKYETKNNPKKVEEYTNTTENDLFLLTFDEFEDDSREVTLEIETLQTNENQNEDIININNNNIKNCNYVKINNTNLKHPKINNITNQNPNIRKINKINKRDIYYIPQNDFSKSLIRNSESLNKIYPKNNLNINNKRPNTNRNFSINSISKLNLNQIVYNKKNKFIKEDEKEMAIRRYKIENEYKINNISNNLNEDQNYFKIKLEIKEIKNDIKRFKEKIKRKRKIIKEFKSYLKDILKKYYKYIGKIDDVNNNNFYFDNNG